VHETILDLQDSPILVTEATEEFECLEAEYAELRMVAGAGAITWIARLHGENILSAPVTTADLALVGNSRFMLGRDRRNGRGSR
jgi:hypothetical protein